MRTLMAAGSAVLLALGQFAYAESDTENRVISEEIDTAHPEFLQTTPIYRDGVLTIPEGTLVDSEGASAFRDIVLIEEEDGRFVLVESHEGELAYVETVEVTTADESADEVSVNVTGNKSTPCVHLLPPAISQVGNEFTVVLPLSRPTAEVCILVLEFFDIDFTLPTADLEPGEYSVIVNDVEATFTVE